MNNIDHSQKLEALAELAKQHDELVSRLAALQTDDKEKHDQLEIIRLKKQQRELVEQIKKLKSSLIPDKPA